MFLWDSSWSVTVSRCVVGRAPPPSICSLDTRLTITVLDCTSVWPSLPDAKGLSPTPLVCQVRQVYKVWTFPIRLERYELVDLMLPVGLLCTMLSDPYLSELRAVCKLSPWICSVTNNLIFQHFPSDTNKRYPHFIISSYLHIKRYDYLTNCLIYETST